MIEGTVGTIRCGLDVGDRQSNPIVVVESWGSLCHVLCTVVLLLDSHCFPTLWLFLCILMAIRFEVDAVEVKEVKEVAVLIVLWLGFGVEWGDIE